MRRTILALAAFVFALLLLGACIPAGGPPPTTTTTTPQTSWLFHDEFSGSGLNRAVWGDNWLGNDGSVTKPPNGSMTNCQDPQLVQQPGDGYLHLKLQATNGDERQRGCGWPYAAGLVTSHKSYWFQDGYIEFRAKFPASGGQISNWPGLWTNGQNWPGDGEDDVMEGLSGRACATYHGSWGSSGSHCVNNFGDNEWHTYASDTHNGHVVWYYDGQKIGESAAARSPHYIILQEATGGCCTGPIVAPSEILIDYVRVRP